MVGQYGRHCVHGLHKFVEIFGRDDIGEGRGVGAVAGLVVVGQISKEATEPFRTMVVEPCDNCACWLVESFLHPKFTLQSKIQCIAILQPWLMNLDQSQLQKELCKYFERLIDKLCYIIILMEIKLENDELILQKLSKLKCSQGCQNCANYIVYEMGLYCTQCLSKLQDVPQAQLATLQDLSKLIADMTDSYRKSVKSGSNLLVLKAEAETQGKVIKGLRDGLTIDVKSVFSKVNSSTATSENACSNQYKNEPLEDFFEPNLTTSVLLNDSELFINNLHNLKVVCDGKKVSYEFKESQKNPEAAKGKALKQIDQTGNALNNAQNKVRNIMGRFRDAIKNY